MGYPSGASIADYVAVAIVDGIAKAGRHTMSETTTALLTVYGFATGDPLTGQACDHWRILGEALSIGADLAVLSRAQRGRIEVAIDQATTRSTPAPEPSPAAHAPGMSPPFSEAGYHPTAHAPAK